MICCISTLLCFVCCVVLVSPDLFFSRGSSGNASVYFTCVNAHIHIHIYCFLVCGYCYALLLVLLRLFYIVVIALVLFDCNWHLCPALFLLFVVLGGGAPWATALLIISFAMLGL